jgi:putative CocE/NonD family hydrolase
MAIFMPDTARNIRIERNLPVRMRDGTILRADVYRPDSDGRWPVILMRFLEYPIIEPFVENGEFFVRNGYVFVYSEVRGTGRSDGEFFPLVDEAWGENQDGYDTIEWAGRQAWSNGNVGLIGTSYGAFNQYTTAVTRPPSLKACIPFFGSSAREIAFPRGLYRLEEHRSWALWMALNCLEQEVAAGERAAVTSRIEAAQADHESWYWHLPVSRAPVLEGVAQWHFEHLKHQTDLDWWKRTDASSRPNEIDVPILHVAGWYDLYLQGVIDHYSGLVEQGRTEACRTAQRLVVGPWVHGLFDPPSSPSSLDFGIGVDPGLRGIMLRWFDRWLKEGDSGESDDPAVRLFLMGENRWLEMNEWPPNGAVDTPIYLRQGTGRTSSSLNNGHLTFEQPTTVESPDSYVYDPQNPVIGHRPGESAFEPDYRNREGRLLTYTSEVLKDPLTAIGPLKAVLFAASSAPDTDWVVRLCDVWPDGRSIVVSEGIVRARFRNSLENEEFLEPDLIYRYEIGMAATATTFLPGHRIRVHVTSSDFPKYDRNLNTGVPFRQGIDSRIADNRVYHDYLRPSHVILPVR